MSCSLTEEELWSGLDREAPEIEDHLSTCEVCKERAAKMRATIEAVAKVSMPPLPSLPERIGPYRVHKQIGAGGMGIVYEAEQESPRRRVAVKVIRGGPFADGYRIRLFQREAQTLARLKHPAIAPVHEAGRTAEGQHFLVMDLAQGEPLNDYVRNSRLELREVLELFLRICEAINYAHQRGVIHRDLKPSNVLVDEHGQPKILDFGLARIIDPGEGISISGLEVGRLMGTLPYMSPEEAKGNLDAIDVRSDVYSLGVILYELLTGQLPFKVSRTALPEAVQKIGEEPPRKPSSVVRTLRGDIDTIILKALEKEPSRRYQSVANLAEDIDRFLSNQPILARRANPAYHLRKFVARHRWSVVFLGLLCLLLIVGGLWMYRIEGQLRESVRVHQELADLTRAVGRLELAEAYLERENFDKAYGPYREVLAEFKRLDRMEPRYAGRAMIGLATVLATRERATSLDLDLAEELLAEAVPIFNEAGAEMHQGQLQRIEELRQLIRQRRAAGSGYETQETEEEALPSAPPGEPEVQ